MGSGVRPWLAARWPKRWPQFNSRIEVLSTSGLWKRAFTTSRVLVPMRGWYEWTGQPGDKTPHFLHGPGELLVAAGILAPHRNADGTWTLTFSVVTREARDASGDVHDRMPALLGPDAVDAWLSPVPQDTPGRVTGMLDLLRATSDEQAAAISSYIVDRRVNSTRTVDRLDPGLIAPVEG
ncbi:SOS response-associated peptidase [Cellulomonas hominis]